MTKVTLPTGSNAKQFDIATDAVLERLVLLNGLYRKEGETDEELRSRVDDLESYRYAPPSKTFSSLLEDTLLNHNTYTDNFGIVRDKITMMESNSDGLVKFKNIRGTLYDR